MSDGNRHHTAEPWAAYQHPRGGGDDPSPCVAIVYGALAIGLRPDGRICLAILRTALVIQGNRHRHPAGAKETP